ncbi:MAG: ABC transporter permease [Treponema sp.]
MLFAVVCLSAFVIIFIGGLYEYMFESIESSMIKNEGHFWIQKAGAEAGSVFSEEKIKMIRNIDGVENYAVRGNISGVVGLEERSGMFSGVLFDSELESAFLSVPQEKCKIGTGLATALKACPGDFISGVTGPAGFSAEIGSIVSTESEESDQYYLKLPFSAFGQMDYSLINSVHFHINKKNYTETIQEIKTLFSPPELYTYNTYDDAGYARQVRTIYENNLHFIMIALAITIFFSIAVSYTMIISERSKEFGTMMTLGSSSAHIITLMLYEAFFIAAAGFAGGYGIASAAGLIINAAGGIALPPPPTVESKIILQYAHRYTYPLAAFIEVTAVCTLSSYVVCRQIGRKDIVRQLSDE